MDINTVTLLGRLGKDVDLKYTQSGKAVATLTLAVDDGYGESKHTSWFNIVCWNKTAENVAKYCVKGSQVAITGRLSQRSWDDKDGNKRYTIEVIAECSLSERKNRTSQRVTVSRQLPRIHLMKIICLLMTCSKCHKLIVTLSEYYSRTKCMDCYRDYMREYQRKNRMRIAEQGQARRWLRGADNEPIRIWRMT
jgi:single-strand DNA-binding protein